MVRAIYLKIFKEEIGTGADTNSSAYFTSSVYRLRHEAICTNDMNKENTYLLH